jgi:hypothetical protein
MAISTEVLNTTFADLRGPLVNSFIRSNELFESLVSKAKMPMEGGSYIERSFSGGSPARGVGIYVGDELLNMTRRQQVRKYQVEPHRLVMAINIPKKELMFNSGKLAVIRLIEEYPQTAMESAKADLNKWLLTGVSRGLAFQSAELEGLLTLNGQHSTGIGQGVTNGLLDFTAFASQSDNVQSVAKSSAYFHANQYDSIAAGAWAATGMQTLRKMYRTCSHYAGGPGKGPDLVIMDDDTYTNFENDRLNLVRVKVVEDKTEKSNMLGLDLGVAKVYSSIDLDRTNFTGDALNGVTYFLNTDFIEFPMAEAPKIGEFQERVGDQDVVTALFSMQGNLICTKLPAQGCVAGGGA